MRRIDINFRQAFRKLCTVTLAFSLVPTFFVSPATYAQNFTVQTKRYKPELVVQSGHTNLVTSVAFSPDGKILASGSDDYTVKLWNVETGQQLRSLDGHTGSVTSIAFSADGKTLASGSWDKTVKLWDVETGKQLKFFEGHSEKVGSVAFSPDGKMLASGSMDKTIRLWNIETGRQLTSFQADEHEIESVAFSPDGKILASGSGSIIKLWNVETGERLKSLEGQEGIIDSVAFSPDGKTLASGSWDRTIRLWNVETGQQLRSLEGHRGWVKAVVFSPDGRTLASGGEDNTIKLWSVETGQLLKSIENSAGAVYSVAFSPNGKMLAGANPVSTIGLWDVETGQQFKSLVGHTNSVRSVAVSPDGKILLDGGFTVKLWNIESSQQLLSLKGNADDGQLAVFSPDGKILAIGSYDHTVKLWDVGTGRQLKSLAGHTNRIYSVAFSPDGRTLASGSNDGTARLWSVETGQQLKSLADATGSVDSVAFSPDGKVLAGGCSDHTIKLWSLETGQQLNSLQGHGNRITSVAFSPDGKILASGSSDKTVRLWNVETGQPLISLAGHTELVSSVAFSPDGKTLASGSWDMTVKLWNVETGRQLNTLEGRPGWVTSVAFSPDGHFIISGSREGTIKLWSTESNKQLATFIAIDKKDWAVVTPDGLFDASDGAQALMHFVVNDPQTGYETISLNQLKSRYWVPGLLKKIFDREPLPSVGEFAVTLFPDVRIEQAKPDEPSLKVDLKNRGGGIGRVEVRVNGSEFTPDARNGNSTDRNATNASLQVDIPKDRLRAGDNEVEVIAWNLEGDVQSRAHKYYLNLADGGLVSRGGGFAESKTSKPPSQIDYYAVVTGISNYGSDTLNLRYAAKDAEDMARALTVAARRYFCSDEMNAKKPCTRVHVRLLSTETNKDAQFAGLPDVSDFQRLDPTKSNFEKVFTDLSAATKTDDVVTVYFSGHATSITMDEAVRDSAIADTYLYATREATTLDRAVLANETERRSKTVSSLELAKWLSDIKADKKVLILDTCAAGAVQKDLIAQARDVDPLQTKSIDRLRDRTGFYVLMGSAANAQSYEANEYRQGLLTYSLLEGMTTDGKLRQGRFLDVNLWFSGASDRVEDLAKGIGGVQKPFYFRPCSDRGSACSDTKQTDSANSFDIGRIDDEERKLIPLASRVPLILEPLLFEKTDSADLIDTEGLSERLETKLLEQSLVSARGKSAPINYIKANKAANGISPRGFYSISGDQVTIEVSLIRDKTVLAKVKVVGTRGDVIEKLIAEILRVIPAASDNSEVG